MKHYTKEARDLTRAACEANEANEILSECAEQTENTGSPDYAAVRQAQIVLAKALLLTLPEQGVVPPRDDDEMRLIQALHRLVKE